MSEDEESSEDLEGDQKLESLHQRIRDLKSPAPQRGNLLVQGMGLVFSMGIVVGGSLYLGALLGAWLKREYHSDLLQVLALLGSLASAGLGCYKLMRPMMRK